MNSILINAEKEGPSMICQLSLQFAYTNAVTPSNIQAGFKSTEIYPFNSQIFLTRTFCQDI